MQWLEYCLSNKTYNLSLHHSLPLLVYTGRVSITVQKVTTMVLFRFTPEDKNPCRHPLQPMPESSTASYWYGSVVNPVSWNLH